MSWKSILPVAVALLLTVPTIVVMSPAAVAQDTVPTAPSVQWVPQVNNIQRLYLRFADADDAATDETNQPDCTTRRLDHRPAQEDLNDPRASCPFLATTAADSTLVFQTQFNVLYDVTLVANDSLVYVHHGRVPDDVRIQVEVASSGTLAKGTLLGDSDKDSFTVKLTLEGDTGRQQILKDRALRLTLRPEGDPDVTDPTNPLLRTPTFEISDTGSRLEVRSVNGLRAASWVTNEKGEVKDLFHPLDNRTDKGPRFVGFFALQSAFGSQDAQTNGAPVFSVLYEGFPREIGPGGVTTITGERNDSASQPANGTRVWSFSNDRVDYRGFPAGAYELQVQANYWQGDPISRGVLHTFHITSQSVRLRPFEDVSGGFIETHAHAVQPGGTTTYVLEINNTGSVNDTFVINASAPTGAFGWSAVVGGPDVRGRQVELEPNERGIVTVTVTAPFGAAVGSQAIHLVNATSALDPSARSLDLTLVSTVSQEVRRELGVIVLKDRVELDPNAEVDMPAYVWNRGTRAQNVSFEIQQTKQAGWEIALRQGAVSVDRMILSNIRPGDIAEVTLRAQAPISGLVNEQSITLNATSQDVSGVSTDKSMSFVRRLLSGATLQVLTHIGPVGHTLEVSGDRGGVPDPTETGATPDDTRPCTAPTVECVDDGIDGVWYRAWLTNTGKTTETFELTADSYDWSRNRRCDAREDQAFIPREMDGGFAFYFRPMTGAPQPITSLSDLHPGETAEFYVWRPAERHVDICNDDPDDGDGRSDDFHKFVIQARGLRTGVIARHVMDTVAKDEGGVTAVLVESVERSRDPARPYSIGSPIVNVDDAPKRAVIGGVEVGGTRTYYVRVTNGASWSNWTDDRGRIHAPDVHVTLQGVDKPNGWNVSLRRVVQEDLMNDFIRHPNESHLWLHNDRSNNRREGWIDHELEVVVTAPNVENKTALAGEQDQFTIQAAINGSSAVSLLEIKTVIVELADIQLNLDSDTIFAHPGESNAKLLYAYNNGSSPATVTVRASINESQTTNQGSGWSVSPSSLTFPLAAFKNRTVAILVTPPPGIAPGSRGIIDIAAEYAPSPIEPTRTINETRQLTADVIARGDLALEAQTSEVTIAPGGFANFTMTLRNTAGGVKDVRYRLDAAPIPNWTTTISPETGVIAAGESRTVVLVLRAPNDVINDTRFETIVHVQEESNSANFDTIPLSVNILGGKAIPALSAPKLQKTVDRGGVQSFEVLVKNLGTAVGSIPLEVRSTDQSWRVATQDLQGNNISSVTLGPNELQTINVTVWPPFELPERTLVPIELIASTPDRSQSAKLVLQALVHDYGVEMDIEPQQVYAYPGLPIEVLLRLRNTGNDNDTINASAILVELPDWTVSLSQPEVFLQPGHEAAIRATIRSPTTPLPTPRSYTFTFYAGSLGGESVNVSKNDTSNLILTVPNYRNLDVDRDGFVEVAIDWDRDASNGFEEFREIFSDGLQTSVVAESLLEGRARFFLDVPRDQPHDGIADVWFDPEKVYGYQIEHAPDLNFDGTPDYLLDVDRDVDGKIDHAYDSVTERYWTALQIEMYGKDDPRKQFLVDTTGDGRFDRFYDPEAKLVTRTQTASKLGANFIGIDTDDDGRVDKYYDTKSEDVSDAQVSNFADFALKYWYFFLAFAVFALVTIALLVGRMRRKP